MRNYVFSVVLAFCTLEGGMAQDSIELTNPSFEMDNPGSGRIPHGWINMGSDRKESPPDIQPGYFGVDLAAIDGRNYIGLVIRDNNTWEGIGQKLKEKLKKDSTYTISICMAQSAVFTSVSRVTMKETQYTAPAVLKIWGYNSETQKEELLAESQPVTHAKWMKYTFTLKPTKDDYDEIDLVSFFAKGYEKQNGHLLLDGCSSISRVVQ